MRTLLFAALSATGGKHRLQLLTPCEDILSYVVVGSLTFSFPFLSSDPFPFLFLFAWLMLVLLAESAPSIPIALHGTSRGVSSAENLQRD